MANCPECGDIIYSGAKKCTCGWKAGKTVFVDPDIHKCAYVVDGQRCPADGTISDSTTRGGKWYCRYHHPILHDPVMCHRVFDDMIRNGVPKPPNRRKEMIKAFIERGEKEGKDMTLAKGLL